MSAKEVTDRYASLSGPSRRRAVLRARAAITASLEVRKALRVGRSVAALIRENARAMVAARKAVCS